MLPEEVDTSGITHRVIKLRRVRIVSVVYRRLSAYEGITLPVGRSEEGGTVAHDFEVIESPRPVDVDGDVGSDDSPAVVGSTGVLK